MDDRTTSRLGMAVAVAMLAMACKGSGGAGGRLAVSARTVAPAGGTATATAATGGLDLGDGVVLTRVRLAVQRISLEATTAATPDPMMGAASGSASKEGESGGGDGSGGGGNGGDGSGGGADDGAEAEEVSVGPFAVDLGSDALAGGIHSVFDGDVPAGTYRELRIAVGPVVDAATGSSLADLAGHSVIVEGTVDGAPFTFASALTSTQKVEMTVQVAADGSSSGVTLTIDPHGWFRAADGTRLAPTLEANRAAIEDNVRASIGAELEDEHEGEGGGSGGADDGAGHA